MSPSIVRLLVIGVLVVHGLGHSLGVIGGWGIVRLQGGSSDSWILSPILGARVTGLLEGVVWAIPMIGFVVAAAGLWMGADWWRPVAIVSAVVSLFAIGLFWDQLVATSKIGAIAVDLAVLVGLVVAHWPSPEALGE
jgi:hypothetical protein